MKNDTHEVTATGSSAARLDTLHATEALHDHKLTTKCTRQMTNCQLLVVESVDANSMTWRRPSMLTELNTLQRPAARSGSFHCIVHVSPTDDDDEIAYVLKVKGDRENRRKLGEEKEEEK